MREKLLQKHLLCKKGRKAKLAKLLWMNMHSCTQQEMLILKEPKINNLNSVRLPGPSSPFWKWTKRTSLILLRVMGYMGHGYMVHGTICWVKVLKSSSGVKTGGEAKFRGVIRPSYILRGHGASQQVSYLEPSFLTHHLSWRWWHHNRSEKLNGRNSSLLAHRYATFLCSWDLAS